MGARSNIAIIQGDGTRVWLYGHWMGDQSLTHAVAGLRSGRSDDDAYLARVIFSSMVKDDIDGETGFGITTSITDNEYPVIVIDPGNASVWLEAGQGVTPHHDYQSFIDAFEVIGEDLDDMFAELKTHVVKP